jgi:histidine triad (HIT) family protein
MEKCLFCGIANGSVPSYQISQTSMSLAILDKYPVVPGHILVIPKDHYGDMTDASSSVLKVMILIAKEMGSLLMKKLNADGFNLLSANRPAAQQTFFHLHLHIVPRYKDDGLNLWFHGNTEAKVDLGKIQERLLQLGT